MVMAWPLPQLHSRAIDDNCGQPSGELRVASELVQVLASRQECILHCVLSISLVPQEPVRNAVKRRQATRQLAERLRGKTPAGPPIGTFNESLWTFHAISSLYEVQRFVPSNAPRELQQVAKVISSA
jgi:hypothetical protein